MTTLNESLLEVATIEYFRELNYTYLHTLSEADRQSFADVVLLNRLRDSLLKINPAIPEIAREDAIKKLQSAQMPSLYENNRIFYKYLTDGVDVEYFRDGQIKYDKVKVLDFNNPDNNDWLVVNQFTVIEGKYNRRLDLVVFLNGLPLAVIELKNPTEENATIRSAFNQLQTYKQQIPTLFNYNQILIVSDGISARVGTITADWERFMPWRTIEGEKIRDILPDSLSETRGVPQKVKDVSTYYQVNPKIASSLISFTSAELEVMIKGIFDKQRLLDLLKYFFVFEVEGDKLIKKMAGYHQYHAVNKAIASTVKATREKGDKKVGVVWHTQGSGKSLTMAFYAGKIVQQPELENPTLVVLTDRNDLDNQLFTTFSGCTDLIKQTPIQASDRQHLKELLQVASGGIIFTTLQKFAPPTGEDYPLLSTRRNIIFIADEAHRSQYGLNARVVKGAEGVYLAYGFAKYVRDALPNASFIGFTGTPVELQDKSTPAVFGDYIDIYDIQQAVTDGATVKIYYESRLAKIELEESQRPKIDPSFE